MSKTTLQTLSAVVLLALIATVAVAASRPDAGAPAAAASQAFDAFKNLAGEWQGTNGRGEPVTVSYEVLAGGSAVLERFVHPGYGDPETMLTVYHLDGGDLRLTHYCMEGNQPRMQAESFEGGEVSFAFVDATGLATPESGHMHRAVFRFADDDHFATAWTWREKGQDVFTEWVNLARVK